MEEVIAAFLAPFASHAIVATVSAGAGLLIGHLLHRRQFKALRDKDDDLQRQLEAMQGRKKNTDDESETIVDDRIGYADASQIIANYLRLAFRDVEGRIQLMVVTEILARFELYPQAKIGPDMYSREQLRFWLEHHMGKLLMDNRSSL